MVMFRILPAMLISLSGIQKDLIEERTFIASRQPEGGDGSDDAKNIVRKSRNNLALRGIRSM